MSLAAGLMLAGCSGNQQTQDTQTEVVIEGDDAETPQERALASEAPLPVKPTAMDPQVAELSAQIERIRRLARFAGQLEAASFYADQPHAPQDQVQQAMEAGATAQEKLRLRQIELFLIEQEAQLRNINQGWHDLTPAQRQPGPKPEAE